MGAAHRLLRQVVQLVAAILTAYPHDVVPTYTFGEWKLIVPGLEVTLDEVPHSCKGLATLLTMGELQRRQGVPVDNRVVLALSHDTQAALLGLHDGERVDTTPNRRSRRVAHKLAGLEQQLDLLRSELRARHLHG